jgi:hypothetical protein
MGWMIEGSSPDRGWEFFSSALHPDRLWGPLSLLSNGFQGPFPWGQSGWGVKLTTHLHLVPRSRIRGAIPPLPNTPSRRGAKLNNGDNFTFNILPCMAAVCFYSLRCRFHTMTTTVAFVAVTPFIGRQYRPFSGTVVGRL